MFTYNHSQKGLLVTRHVSDGIVFVVFFLHYSKILTQTNYFVDEIEKISFGENGLFYHSEDHGATIIIPEGAVQGTATLQFGASLLMVNYKSESAESGDFQPVSPFL